MPKPKTVVTLTMNPSVDLSTRVDAVEHTRKLRCAAPAREPGGGGINVARAMRQLGGVAVAVFPAGGTAGHLLRELLQAQGIIDHAVFTEELTRESLSVHEERTGREFRFVFPGPETREVEWRRSLAAVESLLPMTDFLVASGSLPRGVPENYYAQLASACRDHDTRLILDTSGAPLEAALDQGVYFVKPNQRELGQITNYDLDDPHEQVAACRELVERGAAEMVALTLGPDGALLVHKEGVQRAFAPEVEVKSTVGAGDSFVAGLTLALSRHRTTSDAFLYAVAAGTAAVMTPGSELCRLDDTERLYEVIRGDQALHDNVSPGK
jgi:6-phosphofructokinase 2